MNESTASRGLGFWMCLALVIGNMIGSGVFLLPASLAPYGVNSIFGWLLTAAGSVLLAIVFTAVDWRMTKHLTPLLLPLHLAPVAWTPLGRTPRVIVAAVFGGLLAWNLWTLTSIASDFSAIPITPAW